VLIINTKGKNISLDSVKKELVDSVGLLTLTKAVDRIKTLFTNKMKSHIKDRLIN